MSPEARERSFDELASGLASGTLSRGKALRLLGAALLGGALAFTPKVAEAALHKCDSAGECPKGGSCCAGTCCGVPGEPGPSCFPAASSCGKGRVATICADTEEFGTSCLAGCGFTVPCVTTADCEANPLSSGMVCVTPLGGGTSFCLSPCKGGRRSR
jgi:hypothetical protein